MLPTPRRTKVFPLKKYEFKKVTKRRKSKRWSTIEEETLRSGVQKYVFTWIYSIEVFHGIEIWAQVYLLIYVFFSWRYGVGNWRLIFDTNHEIFEDRTPVSAFHINLITQYIILLPMKPRTFLFRLTWRTNGETWHPSEKFEEIW